MAVLWEQVVAALNPHVITLSLVEEPTGPLQSQGMARDQIDTADVDHSRFRKHSSSLPSGSRWNQPPDTINMQRDKSTPSNIM
ncbi:hypothetical protein, partial [Metamycoplasma equirhinis]|uniref:hypothetical protein n=1 Tax=Metamycoplasma equirhinis TaxID=92402 RepID=UPI00359485CC